MTLADLATSLDEAENNRIPLDGRVSGHELSARDARSVALLRDGIRIRRGARPVGYKLGWTSEAMRAAYGIDQPNYGRLFDYMHLEDGQVDLADLIAPKVEPEIAFRTGEKLTSESTEEVILGSGEWAVALEVVDPRWEPPFTWLENTADGSSAARFATGPWCRATGDPSRWAVQMVSANTGQRSGRGELALGSPVSALTWLLDELAGEGSQLNPGEIVLTGALTAPIEPVPGDVIRVASPQLGECHLQIQDEVG